MTQAKLTTAPDTVPGQLTHTDLQEGDTGFIEKVELQYSRSPIEVSQYDLIHWWDQKVINTSHFIRFALMIERVGQDEPEDFDIEKFCQDWAGSKKDGEPRYVTPKQVMTEIQALQQVGAAHVETTVQMSLDL